ncbi:MAG: MFS transporter [Bacteroidetes bacterium]|nr:MAG: MFS transporter [Bacteroidota bacterium]
MMRSYPRSFWLASLSMLLFMVGFNLIIPELNDFIVRLGGIEYKGLIFTVFTISAAIARPFSGRLSDYVGRKWVMYAGVAIATGVMFLYPLSSSVLIFLMLRFIHGLGVGFTPTGATALITDLLPPDRRGSGMGLWGTFISLGIGLGQIMSYYVVREFGFNGLFICSSILTVASSILLFWVEETLEHKEKPGWRHLVLKWRDVFEPPVMPAAMVMFFTASCSGIIFVISPDFSGFLGIPNKGWFFLFYVLSTIFVRLFSGRLSDVWGRRQTLILGVSILIISMILLAFSRDTLTYTIASVIFGMATGLSSPTLFAWTADLSHPNRRGVGSGTLFIALEFGVMFGSFSTTWFYHSNIESIRSSFFFACGCAFVALLYLIWHLRYRK